MTKVAIYTRVSTLEQANEGYSIEGQEKRLKSYCEINDWGKYELFVDAGKSAGSTDRAGLQNLISRLDEFDLILVYKLDRLTRSVRDLMSLLDTFEKHDVKFRSATEVFDTTSAIGKLFITLVGAMAEWERSTIAERTSQGRKMSAEKGNYTAPVPFYYDKIDGKLYPNENRKVVEYMAERVKAGVSLRAVAVELNNSKYMPPQSDLWNKNKIKDVLVAPVTRGHTQISDVFIENSHEAIISESDYEAILSTISTRKHSRGLKHTSVFRGLLSCHQCGQRLTLAITKRKKKNDEIFQYSHYSCARCKADKSVRSVNVIFSEVERAFLHYIKHSDLEAYEDKPTEKPNESIIDVEKIKQQRKKYQQAWAKDLMSDEEFEELIKETDELLDQHNKQLIDEKKKETNSDQIKTARNLILKGWSNMSDEDKETMLSSTISKIEYNFIEGGGVGSKRKPNAIEITKIKFKF